MYGKFTLCLVSLLLFSSPAVAQPIPKRTTQQVIQIAKTFCAAMDAPVTEMPTVSFPVRDFTAPMRDINYLPRWRIHFAGEADIDVFDGSGSICHYFNNAHSAKLLETKQSAGASLPKEDIVGRAGRVLKAAGQTTAELGIPTAREDYQAGSSLAAGHCWLVSYPRVFGNIPYQGQHMNVMIQAETGVVQAFAVMFPTPPPPPVGSVTQTQAIATANERLRASAYATGTFKSATKYVVQPNTFWQKGGSSNQYVGAPCVAWVCIYTEDDSFYEVWVSTNTGSVVGGSVSINIGIKSPNPPRNESSERPSPIGKSVAP